MTISPTLMEAILAMDAYNQGYNSGLTHGETQIGLATFSTDSSLVFQDPNANPNEPTLDQAAGFYAVAYNYGGETVISYRGTDQGSDIWTGWLAGAGIWSSPQVKLAADYYNALFPDTSAHGVTFTGHSLGGGLAGIMGSIYGREATAFDNMPFESSSSNIYYYANLTDEEISNSINSAELEDLRTLSRNTFYGGEEPWEINSQHVSSIAVEDEILSYSRVGQTIPPDILDSYAGGSVAGLFGNLNEVQLHSQALLVNLQFAKDNSHTKWNSIAKSLWGSAFSVAVGEAAGFVSNGPTGNSDAASKMLSALGYSAIDEGVRVFGDTGIRAMFDDADQLGEAVSDQRSNPLFQQTFDVQQGSETVNLSVSDTIAQIFVQYAGILANHEILMTNDPLNVDPEKGVLDATSGGQLLSLDLSKVFWQDVLNPPTSPSGDGTDAPAPTPAIPPINKEELFTALFEQSGTSEVSKTLTSLGLT